MAGSVNKVILVGNLGKDPDVRRLNSGDQVVSFSVATSETWRDKSLGRAQGAHRMAQCRDLQREPRQGRRAILQEGHESLPRRSASDPQMAGPERRRPVHDRGGAAAFPGRTAIARLARRRRRARQLPRGRGSPQLGLQSRRGRRAPPGAVRAAGPARAPGRSTTISRFNLPSSLMLSLSKQRERGREVKAAPACLWACGFPCARGSTRHAFGRSRLTGSRDRTRDLLARRHMGRHHNRPRAHCDRARRAC